jgi:hypothetical protein
VIVERSPLTVEMDAMNSFNVDLLPSAMINSVVNPVIYLCVVDQGQDSGCVSYDCEMDLSMLFWYLENRCQRREMQLVSLYDGTDMN